MLTSKRIHQVFAGIALATVGLSAAMAADCVQSVGTETHCQPNRPTFGFWPTQWRRFPGTIDQQATSDSRRDAFSPPSHQLPDPVHEADPPRSFLDRPAGPVERSDKADGDRAKPPEKGLPDRILPSPTGGDSLREKPGTSPIPTQGPKPLSRLDSWDDSRAAIVGDGRQRATYDSVAPAANRRVAPAGFNTAIDSPTPKIITMPIGTRKAGDTDDGGSGRASENGSESGRDASQSTFRFRPNPLRGNAPRE